jgi:hypothetical protein
MTSAWEPSQDVAALEAAVQIANLWIRGDFDSRTLSARAFGDVVMQIQETTRYMAFHSIAHVGDWCHRRELWRDAGLPAPLGCPECKFGPRRQCPEPTTNEPSEHFAPHAFQALETKRAKQKGIIP